MFDGMKEDFRGLLEEVEDSCRKSMKGSLVVANQTSGTTGALAATATKGTVGGSQPQRSSLIKYIAKTFGWPRSQFFDDDE